MDLRSLSDFSKKMQEVTLNFCEAQKGKSVADILGETGKIVRQMLDHSEDSDESESTPEFMENMVDIVRKATKGLKKPVSQTSEDYVFQMATRCDHCGVKLEKFPYWTCVECQGKEWSHGFGFEMCQKCKEHMDTGYNSSPVSVDGIHEYNEHTLRCIATPAEVPLVSRIVLHLPAASFKSLQKKYGPQTSERLFSLLYPLALQKARELESSE